MIKVELLQNRFNEIGLTEQFHQFIVSAPEVAQAIGHKQYVIISDNNGRFIVAAKECNFQDCLLMLAKTA